MAGPGLQQEYSRPTILPSPHFLWVVNVTFLLSLLTFDRGLGGCLVGVRLCVLADLDLGGLSLTVGAGQVP